MSKRLNLDKKELSKVLKVAIWSGVSALLAVLITYCKSIDISSEMTYYLVIGIPVMNTLLVGAKQFIDENLTKKK